MTTLLDDVLAAHGGLDAWRKLGSLELTAEIDGELFRRRGHAGALASVRVSLDTRSQRLTFAGFKGTSNVAIFEPSRVAIVDEHGREIASRDDPAAHFAGQAMTDPWDDLDLIYAQGYGQYTLLAAPFILALPGVTVREIEPWHESGEVWRRLSAAFPPDFITHRSPMTFCFDEDSLLRRFDFTPSVGAVPASAVYAAAYREVAGLRIPTRHVNAPVDSDGRADEARTFMTVVVIREPLGQATTG